jgi:hypothetical protein
MKTSELNNAQGAFDCFDAFVGKVLSAPHEAILPARSRVQKAIDAQSEQAQPKPKKDGSVLNLPCPGSLDAQTDLAMRPFRRQLNSSFHL